MLKFKSSKTFNNKYCYGVEKQIFHLEYFITTTKMYLSFQFFVPSSVGQIQWQLCVVIGFVIPCKIKSFS